MSIFGGIDAETEVERFYLAKRVEEEKRKEREKELIEAKEIIEDFAYVYFKNDIDHGITFISLIYNGVFSLAGALAEFNIILLDEDTFDKLSNAFCVCKNNGVYPQLKRYKLIFKPRK